MVPVRRADPPCHHSVASSSVEWVSGIPLTIIPLTFPSPLHPRLGCGPAELRLGDFPLEGPLLAIFPHFSFDIQRINTNLAPMSARHVKPDGGGSKAGNSSPLLPLSFPSRPPIITISTGLLDIMIPLRKKCLFPRISSRANTLGGVGCQKPSQITVNEQLMRKIRTFQFKVIQGKSRYFFEPS